MKSIRNECLPPLDREEEIALFKAYRGRKHDQAAKEKIIRANFALVIKLAGKFASTELDVDELISQGRLDAILQRVLDRRLARASVPPEHEDHELVDEVSGIIRD